MAFLWREKWMKEYATFLFGTSPEFDFGVYTAAFLTMKSLWPSGYRYSLPLRLKKTRLAINCYRNDGVTLGSCFVV